MILISVCARKGSKGLPGKNEKAFLRRGSMLARAMDFSFQLKTQLEGELGEMVQVVLSTDIEIREGDVPTFWHRERPPDLAGDRVHKWLVIRDLVDWYEENSLETVEAVIDLDVTRPIRYVQDVVELVALYQDWQPDLAMTVALAKKHPSFDLWEDESANPYLRLYDTTNGWAGARQQLSPVYEWGGEWIIDRDYLEGCSPEAVFTGKVLGHKVGRETALDVDDELDWVILEAVARHIRWR